MTTLYNWHKVNTRPMSADRRFKVQQLDGEHWRDVDWTGKDGRPMRYATISDARWAIRRQSAEGSLDNKPAVEYRVVSNEDAS